MKAESRKSSRADVALMGVQAAALVLLLSACGGQAEPAAEVTPPEPAITAAQKSCGVVSSKYATLGDNGYTITMQGRPKYSERGMTATEIACVLKAVSTPDSVVGQMDATRALDGMQKASWEKFSASWTFHPDNGAKIIVTGSK